MPPAQFIAKATGATVGGLAFHQAFTTPATRKPGDTYVAVVVQDPQPSHVDLTFAGNVGWEELAEIELANATVIIARRVAAEADPATLDLYLTSVGAFILSALFLYRGLDNAAAAIGASGSNIAASTNFACPSRTLAAYSDLYLGIVGVTSAAVAVTQAAGTTERHEALGTKTLELFDLFAEASGATGIKTATTAANQSGVAASIALATLPLIGAGRSFSLLPIGGIGLPLVGV